MMIKIGELLIVPGRTDHEAMQERQLKLEIHLIELKIIRGQIDGRKNY